MTQHPQPFHNENKKKVFDACSNGWKTVDEICNITGLPFQKVNAYLVKLRNENKVFREHSVQRYCASHSSAPFEQEIREKVLKQVDDIIKHEWNNSFASEQPYRSERQTVLSIIRNAVAELRSKQGEGVRTRPN